MAASLQRRRRQGGTQILEFALVAMLYAPLLLGTFVTGMNLVRSNQVNQVCRDLADMYIHGADFSTYSMQQLAQRLAFGLNLQIGASFTGNQSSNTGNGGDGLVTITQTMYVGTTTDPNCVAVGASSCTNHDNFVYTQRIDLGNATMAAQSPPTMGTPASGMVLSAAGIVQNPVTDVKAQLPAGAQTAMKNLWQVSSGGQTPLVDGQVVYVVEFYVSSASLSMGSFPGKGVYARYFF